MDHQTFHIFISYQRKSEEQVTRLAGKLREAGLKVWQDLSGKDTGIPYSVKWWEVIRGALHSALGALIIKTIPWEESKPCSNEMALILENRVPAKVVEEPELYEDNLDALVEQIVQWYRTELMTEENQNRAYLFTQAYRMEQDPRIAHLLPGKIGIGEARSRYRWYTGLQKYLKSSGILRENPEDGSRMAVFLKKAKRKILREQIIRLLVVLIGVAGLVLLISAIRMLPNLLRNTAESDYRGKLTAAIDLIRDTGEYDPVSAMTLLTTDPAAKNLDVSRSFYFMQHTMVELLSRKYPLDFYPPGSAEATAVQALGTQDYPAVFDPVSGDLTVRIGEKETSLLQDCAPGAVCYVPERNELLVASDRRIRAYDLDAPVYAIPLEYNFEEIVRLAADEDRIFGITKSGSVICWNQPIPVKTIRRKLDEGVLLPGGAAVYAENGDLILQRENRETMIPVQIECNGVTAVSADGQLAAAAGIDRTGRQCVILFRPDSGEMTTACEMPGAVTSMSFSGSQLYAVTLYTLTRIDTANGRTDTVQAEGTYYMTAPYRDGIIVGRTDGMAAAFGSDLRRLGNWTEITAGSVAVKQLAASETYGTAFAACRGGNTIAGCKRINLENGAIHRLALQAEEGMTSNTSVAVSENGEFVAYGFPNGRITVWSTDVLNLLYESRVAAEPLIALRFGGDGIYALGASGTVYRAEFDGLVRKVEQETYMDYWNAYAEKAAGIHRRMYELGLTYITPR